MVHSFSDLFSLEYQLIWTLIYKIRSKDAVMKIVRLKIIRPLLGKNYFSLISNFLMLIWVTINPTYFPARTKQYYIDVTIQEIFVKDSYRHLSQLHFYFTMKTGQFLTIQILRLPPNKKRIFGFVVTFVLVFFSCCSKYLVGCWCVNIMEI